jgi:signal transduction histidine kinase
LPVKLLLAHMVVLGIGLLAFYLVASTTAPRFFDYHVGMMRGPGPTGMGPRGTPRMAATVDAALAAAFQAALNQALLQAGLVALVAALGASAFAAYRIATPVHALAGAARRIAGGQYRERVPAGGGDELAALAASFNEMAAALERAEQRRLELLGDVAHELRTPISTVEGYVEGLLDGVVEPRAEVWALLHDETRRMGRLVDDLRDLWRAEVRQLPLTPTTIAPLTIVQTTVARFASDFAAAGLSLHTVVAEDLPPVRADGDRAVQVLTNLLGNGLRYTPAPGTVEVSATRANRYVRFAVRDTGLGIAPEHLAHVFERFYRVDKSRSRTLGGSGIGLTIARALVEAMGGQIWATSPGPGQGATFAFTLPVVPS